jgi:ABC-2 type transport system permease protein
MSTPEGTPPIDPLIQPIREIDGPSAIGSDRQRLWQLVWLTSVSAFRHLYVGSSLSYLWLLLQPILFFAVLYTVFTRVLRFGGQVPNYPVLLLFDIVLFQFFSEATTGAMRSFVARGALVRKMQFPRIVMPLSAVLTVGFVLAGNLLVVFVWILGYGVDPTWTWLLLPVTIASLAAVTAVVGVLLSALFVRFRDIAHFWIPFRRMLFYAGPVIFPFEFIPKGILRDVAAFNPLSPIFVEARRWIIDSSAPSWTEVAGGPLATAAPFLVFGALCVTSAVLFTRQARTIAEDL